MNEFWHKNWNRVNGLKLTDLNETGICLKNVLIYDEKKEPEVIEINDDQERELRNMVKHRVKHAKCEKKSRKNVIHHISYQVIHDNNLLFKIWKQKDMGLLDKMIFNYMAILGI